jgi:hypothetical protein
MRIALRVNNITDIEAIIIMMPIEGEIDLSWWSILPRVMTRTAFTK